jgi:hypothetical protein
MWRLPRGEFYLFGFAPFLRSAPPSSMKFILPPHAHSRAMRRFFPFFFLSMLLYILFFLSSLSLLQLHIQRVFGCVMTVFFFADLRYHLYVLSYIQRGFFSVFCALVGLGLSG